MDSKYLVSVLVVTPLVLVIALTVFHEMALTSRTPFEGFVYNETVKDAGPAGQWYVLQYAMRDNTTASELKVYNGTQPYTNYTLDKAYELDHSRIYIGTDGTGQINITYPAYTGSGYTSYVKVHDLTLSGQKLGSLVPYILISLAVVTIIVGAFGVSKLV